MGEIISPTNQRTPSSVGKVEDTDVPASSCGPILADRSPSSDGSTPELDQDHELELHDGDEHETGPPQEDTKQPAPPQKRKGGRKPIYATSEERKQRNRQAQAAFRERRTEYIKQLETTIKRHEENLTTLQQSQRQALDECLMLRYKNSLLERILVEKGIDVQMVLNRNSPPFGPSMVPNGPSPAGGPQGIQRLPPRRFTRRPLSISAKPEQIVTDGAAIQNRSPMAQPSSGSHLPSPITLGRSPNFTPQGGAISPSFGPIAQPGQQLRPQQQIRPQPYSQAPRPAFAQPTIGSAQSSASGSSINSTRDAYAFVSPFQNHYDQLDQEYDAQASMLDDQDVENQAFPTASFSAPALPPHVQQQQPGVPPASPANPNHVQGTMPPPDSGAGATQVQGLHAQFEHFDPMLDADPFGLSASMHFPTPFTFESHR